MSKELLLVVDAVANEKGVPKDVIFEAMEAALASAAKKRYPAEEVLARVSIDKHSGEYETLLTSSQTVKSVNSLRNKSRIPSSAASRRRRPSRSSCNVCVKPSARRLSKPMRIASVS